MSMGLPKFSATTHFKMVSSSEHTKNVSTMTDDNMAALTINSNLSQRPPPTFGSLPTELKKLIVYHADDSCLANLRLTNKELNAITIKPFGERLLAERRFMLSEYSLQGLVDLTAHPDFGPCVRKVLLNTHALSDEIKKWRQTKGKKMSGTKRDAVWRRIQTISKNYRDEAMIDKMFGLVTQALSNLKKHGNQVTLGVFDDVVCVAGRKHLRKAYGFEKLWGEVSPLSDLAPKQWVPSGETPFVALRAAMGLVEFPDSPLVLDFSSALSDPNGWLDELLLGAVMAGDGTLKRDVDICVRVGLDWSFRLLSPDAAHDRLIFEYQGTTIDTCSESEVGLDFIAEIIGSKDSEPRYDYGSGTCSLYSPCVLGHLNDAIDKGAVSEIRISSCATEADRLVFGICRTGGPTLQRLVLVDLHLFGHGCRHFIDEKDSAWPYLQGIRSMLSHHCPKLRNLVMERVYYHVEDIIGGMVLVEERREWNGVSGVLSGLTSLISEMTTLDEEQRERWSSGEIDADGNDIVAEQ